MRAGSGDPRAAVGRFDHHGRFGRVARDLQFAVPLEVMADADRQDTGETDLGEVAAEVEIAPGFSFR